MYRASVSDPKALDSGVKGVLRAFNMRAFAEPLRQFVGEVKLKTSTAEVSGVPGKVQRALLSLKASDMRKAKDPAGTIAPGPEPVEVLWMSADQIEYGALSFDAVPVLAALYAASTDKAHTHAANERVVAAVHRLGKEASFVVLLEPNRLGLSGRATLDSDAPILLGLGRTGTRGWVTLDADRGATEALAKNLVLGD